MPMIYLRALNGPWMDFEADAVNGCKKSRPWCSFQILPYLYEPYAVDASEIHQKNASQNLGK